MCLAIYWFSEPTPFIVEVDVQETLIFLPQPASHVFLHDFPPANQPIPLLLRSNFDPIDLIRVS